MSVSYRSRNKFESLLETMVIKNIDFTYREIGSTTRELLVNGRKIKNKSREKYMKGSHLIRMLLLEVEKRINNNIYTPKNVDPDRKLINTIMFDRDNIYKFRHTPIVAIDINSCYWTTAYNVGAISEKLFKKGMDGGNDWKHARNASIGALNTLIKEYKNIDGKIEFIGSYRRPYNMVRLDIIDYVWEISNEICNEIKDGFCFFLTDCFFVTKNNEKKIYDLLEKYNYKAKSKNITIENIIDDKIFTVFWSDKNNFNKKHTFAEKHLIKWKK